VACSRSSGLIIGGAFVAVALAGCAASAPQSTSFTPTMSQGLARVHASVAHSSLATDYTGARFFISDAADESVDILTYPGGTQIGQITGLNEPQGTCSHEKTAWLANTGDSGLVHYNAAGKTIATLSDAGQYPVGCALDKQGDLAATNIISTSGGPGSVSIWKHATGNPTNYPLPGASRAYFVTYDPRGNLFVDGSNASGAFVLYELPAGGSALVPITVVGATINFPGNVKYAYHALELQDQEASQGHAVIYKTHIRGHKAIVDGRIGFPVLDDATDWCFTPFGTVIVPDAGSASVQIYTYPAGGLIKTISGFGQPIDCAFLP